MSRPPSFVPTGIADLDDLATPIGTGFMVPLATGVMALPGAGSGNIAGATIGWTSGGVPITEATRATLTAGRVQIGRAQDGLPIWGYPGQTTRTEGGAVVVRNDQLGPGSDTPVPIAIINPQGGTPTGGGAVGGGGAQVVGLNGTTQTVMVDPGTVVRPVLDSLSPRLNWIDEALRRQAASAQATAEHRELMGQADFRRDVIARLTAIQARQALQSLPGYTPAVDFRRY
jgi:hypothetical protein